jgi:phosphatidylethanolamine-binding protein (PEBP) family uncharacterized protein
MTPRSWSRAGVTFLFGAMLVACNRDVAVPSGVASLDLKSSSFSGDMIPAQYSSCAGESSVSPALKWSAPPAGTQSFALIAIDRDSPFGFRFVHWVLFDLPPETRELPEGICEAGTTAGWFAAGIERLRQGRLRGTVSAGALASSLRF